MAFANADGAGSASISAEIGNSINEDASAEDPNFTELCTDLNLSADIRNHAWANWGKLVPVVSMLNDLKVNKNVWYACMIYMSSIERRLPCRVNFPETEELSNPEVTVTQLSHWANMTMLSFFKSMSMLKEYMTLPEVVLQHMKLLERKYCVTSALFHKFEKLFPEIFREEEDLFPLSSEKENVELPEMDSKCIKQWIWVLFLLAKDVALMCGNELIIAFHLLLCAFDHVIRSVPNFILEPPFSDLVTCGASLSDPQIVLQALASHSQTSLEELLSIKSTYWQPFIVSVCISNPANIPSLLQQYQRCYRKLGDIDELLFLKYDPLLVPLAEKQTDNKAIASGVSETNFTHPVTPVRAALNTLQQLQIMLRQSPSEPSPELQAFFQNCSSDPNESIQCRIKQLHAQFVTKFLQALPPSANQSIFEQTAHRRFMLATNLYYRVLEAMLKFEESRLSTSDFSALLNNDSFHKALLACSVEVILIVYSTSTSSVPSYLTDVGSELCFPWVLEVFDLNPYNFMKVLESFIVAEPRLTADVVKHLQHVENRILEQMAWQSGSPVFDMLEQNVLMSPEHKDSSHFDASPTQLFQSPSITADSHALPSTAAAPKSPARSFALRSFLNKVSRLAYTRLQILCKYLDINHNLVLQIWSCLQYAFMYKSELFRDRHIDQITMCCIYALCKVLSEKEIKFKTIVSVYRRIPHASTEIYKKVLVRGSHVDSIINFYNTIFMHAMKGHILQYTNGNVVGAHTSTESPSQLTASPINMIPGHRNFFVSPMSPLKTPESSSSPRYQLFTVLVGDRNLNSTEKLKEINEAIRSSPTVQKLPEVKKETPKSQKRLHFEDTDTEPASKITAVQNSNGNINIIDKKAAAIAAERSALTQSPKRNSSSLNGSEKLEKDQG